MPNSKQPHSTAAAANQEVSDMYAAVETRQQAWSGARTIQPDACPAKSMWKGTTVNTRADGNDESFAIGPDGFVWSYELATAGQAAGRLISTGLPGSVFSVGQTGDGRTVVVAAEGATLRYVVETGMTGQRWSTPTHAAYPGAQRRMQIERVLTQTRFGNLFVGLVVSQLQDDGTRTRALWDAVWACGSLVFLNSPVDWARGNSFWLEHLAGDEVGLN